MAALYPGSCIHGVCVLNAYKYGENVIIHYSLNVFVFSFFYSLCFTLLDLWTGTVGQDSLDHPGVWKWHPRGRPVHESGIASPVNIMNNL